MRSCAQRLAVDRIGAKARLIPEIELGVGPFAWRAIASGSRWYARRKGFCGVSPVTQATRQLNPGTTARRIAAQSVRAQSGQTTNQVEPVLPRILPIDPAKHLPFLPRGQGPWAAGRGACRDRVESVTTPTRRIEPAIDRAPVKAVAGDHLARALALRTRSTPSCGWSPRFRDPVSIRLTSWRNGVSHNQHVLSNLLTYE